MDRVKKKIGVIGLGVMGRRHCEAAKKVLGAELAAVCDLNAEAVKKIQAEFSARAAYSSWQEMLEKEPMDVLSIVTHGPSHAEIVEAAAQAGVKNIFCEKPIATSLKSAVRMIEICRQHQTRLAVNYNRRWSQTYRNLKQLLKEGTIGEIRHFTFEMGGGQMASNGGHFWDLVRYLTGREAVKVLGYLDSTCTRNPRGDQFRDPGAYGLLWLEGGIKIFFNLSEDFGVPLFIEIMGSVGRVLIDEQSGKFEVWARRPEDRSLPFTKRPPLVQIPFSGEKVDMVSSCADTLSELLSDGPVSCSGEDGLASLMISIGVHHSHERGNQPVKLPLTEESFAQEYPFT